MFSKRNCKTTFLRLLVHFIVLYHTRVRAEGESEEDDELISQLLDTPIGNQEDSEVSKILKVLEAAELASTSTTTTTPPSTTTASTTTTTTTPKPSPFFITESPFGYSSRRGKIDSSLDDVIPFLGKQLQEVSQWIDEDTKNGKEGGWNRRSDNHEPPVESLLWSTARAVWEVSRPVFYKTKTGRKISLLKDTFNLPFRTIGAVKSHIHDLKYHSHGHHHHHHHPFDKKRSVHHHHPLDHGWGWDPHVVYVKYEPENSLFKSWLRFLYRVVKPAALTKLRLKKMLIRIKLRFLGKLVQLIKSAKLQKLFAALRAITTKLQILKARKHPNLVVLKETGTTKAPPAYGWGWGWQPPPPPPPPPVYGPPHHHPPPPEYGPPPKPVYGPPPVPAKPSHTYGPPDLGLTYGPPAKSSHGYQSYNPSNTYGPPPTTENPLRIAYNHENTYSNYRAPPSQYLMAPEPNAQASRHHPQEIEAPSYAKYLQQFGINPSSLSDNPDSDSLRYLRQSETDSSKELDVPYLITNSNSTEEIKKRM